MLTNNTLARNWRKGKFYKPVCFGFFGSVLAKRARQMVIMSTTSCKTAPQKAGIRPVKATSSRMITTTMAVICRF